MFCKHQWKETARTATLPSTGEIRGGAWTVERLRNGVTTILWECQNCHAIRKEEMLGQIIK